MPTDTEDSHASHVSCCGNLLHCILLVTLGIWVTFIVAFLVVFALYFTLMSPYLFDSLDLKEEIQPICAQHLWEILQDRWQTVSGDDLRKLMSLLQYIIPYVLIQLF